LIAVVVAVTVALVYVVGVRVGIYHGDVIVDGVYMNVVAAAIVVVVVRQQHK